MILWNMSCYSSDQNPPVVLHSAWVPWWWRRGTFAPRCLPNQPGFHHCKSAANTYEAGSTHKRKERNWICPNGVTCKLSLSWISKSVPPCGRVWILHSEFCKDTWSPLWFHCISPSFFCFCPVDEWVLCWFIRALISCLTFQWALPYTIATVIGPVSFTTLLTAWNKGPPCSLCWDLWNLSDPLDWIWFHSYS